MDPEVESASIQANVFPEVSEYLPVVIGPGTDSLGDIGPGPDNLGDTNSNEVLSDINSAFTPPRAATSSPLAVYHSLSVESSSRESSSSQTQSELSSLYRVTQRPGGLGAVSVKYCVHRTQDSKISVDVFLFSVLDNP
ncbi:hypothetical protein K435DRAFT_800530 [Dendrothele bispora CBS 962.96]|uniref:Uncharacterized protein n=1 Tax=Dendrothele bispora (strain CBS 962.96) TaxID=1314807 RepID=A0A4V4HEW7_DENBC|nr:hypothetical protein K435DRAFT_800530 [Dendrothele bispora CBS 962.96]